MCNFEYQESQSLQNNIRKDVPLVNYNVSRGMMITVTVS